MATASTDGDSLVVGFGVGRQWVSELGGLELIVGRLAGPDEHGNQKSEDKNARDGRKDDDIFVRAGAALGTARGVLQLVSPGFAPGIVF